MSLAGLPDTYTHPPLIEVPKVNPFAAAAVGEVLLSGPETGLDTTELEKLFRLSGALGGKFSGIQYDLNQTWRTEEGKPERASLPLLVGASLCDHDCTIKVDEEDEDKSFGKYTCPAAFSLNVGARPQWLTPAETVLQSIDTLAKGADLARQRFFAPGGEFDAYCHDFFVPPQAAEAMKRSLDKPGVEVNLFGGNPEMHRQITTIIREVKRAGHRVHFTTTGRRFMFDKKFVEEIIESPPDLIALSADDFDDGDHIRRLASLSLEELAAERRTVPKNHGQRQKAYEAIYVAKLAAERGNFPPLLFNMVLHPGNLHNAHDIIEALSTNFPGVLVNPFPAQSAFLHEAPALSAEHAPNMRDFVESIIEAQTAAIRAGRAPTPYAPRLHYWSMLGAVFDWAGDNHELAMNTIVGEGIWQCYRRPMAGRYDQVGGGVPGTTRASEDQHPGGYLGCFWNKETVTKPDQQVWDMQPQTVSDYLVEEKSQLGHCAENACPGCAFPRLTDDMPATEAGMHPEILPFYLKRRAEVFGF